MINPEGAAHGFIIEICLKVNDTFFYAKIIIESR